ncbi:hypothetical protein CWATWH0402_4820 [Crocosphaera watsonii WH 0402]|uniref:Uncharacterized protein n=1 Tax=Crocosphaera watsonii WH 0402 TaxID=1284629 RepID=T2JZF3_CROWT|nr:hypothetical protein CWATWH0402_4820 [Crocosphaera watsonii WH 0402]
MLSPNQTNINFPFPSALTGVWGCPPVRGFGGLSPIHK